MQGNHFPGPTPPGCGCSWCFKLIPFVGFLGQRPHVGDPSPALLWQGSVISPMMG